MKRIITLIEETIGLRHDLVNSTVWEWVLKERMKHCEVNTYKSYLELLHRSPSELQELIELVITPETWFFRDKEGLDFLIQFVNVATISTTHPLKILSLPCSTGEEPYSIAMALVNAGLKKTQFKIDALDISKKSLIIAKKGIYGNNSFRNKNVLFQQRYFEQKESSYVLYSEIKELVNFHYFNVNGLNQNNKLEKGTYSFIFCRNLLIYLSEKAQLRTFELIKKLLAPKGFLMVGFAETRLAYEAGFRSVPFPKAYAFQLSQKSDLASAPSIPLPLNVHRLEPCEHLGIRPKKGGAVLKPSLLTVPDEKEFLMQQAFTLANEGNFEDAEKACLAYIKRFGAHEEIYYIMALIQHALGDEDKAEALFKKVIYLQPTHYEALVYLALLSEKRGDYHKAELFHKRIQKSRGEF